MRFHAIRWGFETLRMGSNRFICAMKKKKLKLKIVLEFSKLENIYRGIYFKGFRRFTRRLDKISLNHIANSHATIEKMVNDL